MAEAESVSPKLFSLSPASRFDTTGLYSCSGPSSTSRTWRPLRAAASLCCAMPWR
jgi:hypothetical protein